MKAKTIITIVLIVIILYFFISWLMTSSTSLASLTVAGSTGKNKGDFKPNKSIDKSKLGKSAGGSNNFTYSIWLFVDDWSYRLGEQKVIFSRVAGGDVCPRVYLGEYENNLTIEITPYQSSGAASAETHKCEITNIPLQKWVNVLFSVYGRSLDVYVDGKLSRTCVLPGPAHIPDDADIILFPTTKGVSGGDNSGFGGYISNFKYWPDATNPQQAWDIYKQGYGGSLLGGLFDKYRIQVDFLEDGTSKASFQI